MAKGKKSIFFCQNCGHEESKWLGQCPMCKEWNTFVEEKMTLSKTVEAAKSRGELEVVTLSSVSTTEDERIKTGIGELDRVLGGGIVPGSLVLVGGDPGLESLHFFYRFVRDWRKTRRRCCTYRGKNL